MGDLFLVIHMYIRMKYIPEPAMLRNVDNAVGFLLAN